MVRTPCCEKGLKKGTWTPEEDSKLIAYVTRYGCWNWRLLPKFAGLERCGKSCRLRWMNYLKPNIKRGNYTQEEEETISRLHEQHGNRWSMIAAHLPGRTDNEIKNYWHTTLKKRFQPNSVTNGKPRMPKSQNQSPIEPSPEVNSVPNSNGTFQSNTSTSQITNYSPLSPESSSSQFSHIAPDIAVASIENLLLEDGFASHDAYTELISTDFWTEPFVADNCYVTSETVLVPPLVIEPESFSPMFDATEPWSQNHLYEKCFPCSN